MLTLFNGLQISAVYSHQQSWITSRDQVAIAQAPIKLRGKRENALETTFGPRNFIPKISAPSTRSQTDAPDKTRCYIDITSISFLDGSPGLIHTAPTVINWRKSYTRHHQTESKLHVGTMRPARVQLFTGSCIALMLGPSAVEVSNPFKRLSSPLGRCFLVCES